MNNIQKPHWGDILIENAAPMGLLGKLTPFNYYQNYASLRLLNPLFK
jgi:hypothetical protein